VGLVCTGPDRSSWNADASGIVNALLLLLLLQLLRWQQWPCASWDCLAYHRLSPITAGDQCTVDC